MRPSSLLSTLFALAAVSFAGSASAETHCGSASAGWNVPTGAVALSRGGGPVRDTLSAVGEYRSHSMISHGPGGWVTHASMKLPDTNGWPYECRVPLNGDQLKNGYPAASQVTQGAIYTYLYSDGSNEALYYQNGNGDGANRGLTVANWLWNSMPYTYVMSQNDGSAGFYRLGTPNGLTNYSLYQFRTLEGRNTTGAPWNNGIVCSTTLAYAQYQAGQGAINDFSYNGGQVQAGLNALKRSAHDQCVQTNGFWGGLGAAVACVGSDVCDNMGNEVTNCMSTGKCGATYSDPWYLGGMDHVGTDWQGVANGTTGSDSISPDAIGGWNGHSFGRVAPNPVWSYDGNNTPQWNSGGNVYSCWD